MPTSSARLTTGSRSGSGRVLLDEQFREGWGAEAAPRLAGYARAGGGLRGGPGPWMGPGAAPLPGGCPHDGGSPRAQRDCAATPERTRPTARADPDEGGRTPPNEQGAGSPAPPAHGRARGETRGPPCPLGRRGSNRHCATGPGLVPGSGPGPRRGRGRPERDILKKRIRRGPCPRLWPAAYQCGQGLVKHGRRVVMSRRDASSRGRIGRSSSGNREIRASGRLAVAF